MILVVVIMMIIITITCTRIVLFCQFVDRVAIDSIS